MVLIVSFVWWHLLDVYINIWCLFMDVCLYVCYCRHQQGDSIITGLTLIYPKEEREKEGIKREIESGKMWRHKRVEKRERENRKDGIRERVRERGTKWLTNRGDLWPSAQNLRTYCVPLQLNQPTNLSLRDELEQGSG